jgi:nucleoid-associated protein YgaU
MMHRNVRLLLGGMLLLALFGTGSVAAAKSVQSPLAWGGYWYTVKRGDSLSSIALATYGNAAFASCIANRNGITNPNSLMAGRRIYLPRDTECRQSVPPPSTPTWHVVTAGETLNSIACRYYRNCDWQRVYNANRSRLPNGPGYIWVGLRLYIP